MTARHPVRVAYLGPDGSFSHAAARRRFGARGARWLPCADIPSVVDAVLAGRVDLGVVPVENTTSGMIGDALDVIVNGAFTERGFAIVEELHLDIHLALLGRGPLDAIRRVYSHAVPLRHCHAWIRRRLKRAAVESAGSTSQAAARAAREKGAAAIGTPEAARLFGLKILKYPLMPERINRTSFFVLGHAGRPPRGAGRIALAVTLPHRPGALYRALGVLAARRLNLTRIESRPLLDRPWEYTFFIEFEGQPGEARARAALRALARSAQSVRVLGAYGVRRLR